MSDYPALPYCEECEAHHDAPRHAEIVRAIAEKKRAKEEALRRANVVELAREIFVASAASDEGCLSPLACLIEADSFDRITQEYLAKGATATSAPSPQGAATGTSRSSPADASAESVPGSGTEPFAIGDAVIDNRGGGTRYVVWRCERSPVLSCGWRVQVGPNSWLASSDLVPATSAPESKW